MTKTERELDAETCTCGCKNVFVYDFWLFLFFQSAFRYYGTDGYNMKEYLKDFAGLFLNSYALAEIKFRVQNRNVECKNELCDMAKGMIMDPIFKLSFV